MHFNGLILQLILIAIDKLQKIIYSKNRKEQRGVIMKITIDYDSSIIETEIHIKCASMNEQIESFISELCLNDSKMVGYIDDEAFLYHFQKFFILKQLTQKYFSIPKKIFIGANRHLLFWKKILKIQLFQEFPRLLLLI